MSLCLTLGALTVALPVSAFTLAWSHSVEKTRWEEDWRIEGDRLVLIQARVQGSGAGMEVPDGAVLDGAYWRWTPDLPPHGGLTLGRAPGVPSHEICTGRGCLPLERLVGRGRPGEPAGLAPCPGALGVP